MLLSLHISANIYPLTETNPGPASRINQQQLNEKSLPHMPQLEIQRDDVTLLVKTQGPRKGPTLLFLHADGESLSDWSSVFSCLRPRHWQLAAPDLGGRGEIGPARNYAFEDFLGDAHQIIQGLKGRPLVLVGSSIGGLMALLLIEHYPSLVDGLVLLDTPSHLPLEVTKRSHSAADGISKSGSPVRRDPQTGSKLLLESALSDPLRLARAAQSVSVPALFLYGSKSELVGEKEICRLRRDIPHLETETVDAGHLIAQDNPQGVADKIASFVPTLIPETIH